VVPDLTPLLPRKLFSLSIPDILKTPGFWRPAASFLRPSIPSLIPPDSTLSGPQGLFSPFSKTASSPGVKRERVCNWGGVGIEKGGLEHLEEEKMERMSRQRELPDM
jgi:hypothetical protein